MLGRYKPILCLPIVGWGQSPPSLPGLLIHADGHFEPGTTPESQDRHHCEISPSACAYIHINQESDFRKPRKLGVDIEDSSTSVRLKHVSGPLSDICHWKIGSWAGSPCGVPIFQVTRQYSKNNSVQVQVLTCKDHLGTPTGLNEVC